MAVTLNMQKTITMTGYSRVDGEIAETYSATINTENPEQLTYTKYINNQTLYKANRADINVAKSEFEDALYKAQDEMIAEVAKQSEVTE